jgi:hypothetical protein
MYGILKAPFTNTGRDDQLDCVFITPLSIQSNQPTTVVDTVNLKRKTAKSLAQRWEIETSLSPIDPSTNFLINSVSAAHGDMIYIRMPQPIEVSEIPGGERTVTLGTRGLAKVDISSKGVNMLGMFVKFSSHAKVYLVIKEDATSITVSPSLRQTLVTGEKVRYGDWVTMQGFYETSTHLGMRYDSGALASMSGVRIVEAL